MSRISKAWKQALTGDTKENPLRLATFMAASLPRSSTRWTCHWFVITSSLAVWTTECTMAMMTTVIRLGHPGLAIFSLGLMANRTGPSVRSVRPSSVQRDEGRRVSALNRCYGRRKCQRPAWQNGVQFCDRSAAAAAAAAAVSRDVILVHEDCWIPWCLRPLRTTLKRMTFTGGGVILKTSGDSV